ncbi:MAG TPA: ABC transporter permease, partial [Blastocatellia bacterium]
GRATASGAAQNFRRLLVSTEIALAVVLLVGSGLMVKGFWKLLQIDPGFSSAGLLTMRLATSPTTYPDSKTLVGLWSRLHEKLEAVHGVESASMVSGLPPVRRINANDTQIEGLAPGPDSPIQNVDYWNAVTPDYFNTMHARLIEGRFLDDRDGDGAAPVVVINQSMARHFYGNQSPIGRRIALGGSKTMLSIIGVVGDIKNAGLDQPAGTELFLPYAQQMTNGFGLGNFNVVLRTTGDPDALSRPAQDAISSVDPEIPISAVQPMEAVMGTAQSRPRFLTLVLGIFSALALVLAAIGIYGLMAYSVTQRTQEIGIRMALGAGSGGVLRMILRYGLTLTFAGMLAGLVAAFALTRLMSALLFQVAPTDLFTFLSVGVGLAVTSVAACYIPARRATRIDPMVALRYE